MSVETLLSRLSKVRPAGKSAWMACCPAHQDKSPSLTITERPDGTVLLYCHAMCGAEAVLQSVGLDWSDLFPKDSNWKPAAEGARHRWPAADVLAALADEAWIVFHAANMIVKGPGQLTEADRQRVFEAAQRISRAREMATGKTTPTPREPLYPAKEHIWAIEDNPELLA